MRINYTGILSDYQLYAKDQFTYTKLNPKQHFLFKRVVHGLNVYSKEEVQTMIANLPDDCTVEDIQYHLYVIEKVQNGMQNIEESKALTHKEAQEKMSEWL